MKRQYHFWRSLSCNIGLVLICAAAPVACTKDDDDDTADATLDDVVEIAIREIKSPAKYVNFVNARKAFIDVLKQQDGVGTDLEFKSVSDFFDPDFSAPRNDVYIGMTQYKDEAAFTNASALSTGVEFGALSETINVKAFGGFKPLTAGTSIDLANMVTGEQVIEIAVRNLASYTDFSQQDYEAKRDAFLELLKSQEGVVQEYQWVSISDANLVVGMTVYENLQAFFALGANTDFTGSQAYTDFVTGSYAPNVAGYLNTAIDKTTEEADLSAISDTTDDIAELAIRNVTGDLNTFTSARDAFVAELVKEDGVSNDREFAANRTLGQTGVTSISANTVFIGMTQYATSDAMTAVQTKIGSGEAGGALATTGIAFFTGLFDLVVSQSNGPLALVPLEDGTPVDLSQLVSSGQYIEIAVRDLSGYSEIQKADYNTKRLAFIDLLYAQKGVVREFQWKDYRNSNIVVGMTVYTSEEAFTDLLSNTNFTSDTAFTDFLNNYPPNRAAYYSTVVK